MKKIIASLSLTIFVLVGAIIILLYTDPNYALVKELKQEYNRSITPFLYTTPSETITITKSICSKSSLKQVTHDSVQLCINSSSYKQPQILESNSIMIPNIEEGKQIVIMPTVNLNPLINELNNSSLSFKTSSNYKEHFNGNEIKSAYDLEYSTFLTTPEYLSYFNDFNESSIVSMLLDEKKHRIYKSSSIYKLNVNDYYGFQINDPLQNMPVTVNLYKNNTRYNLMFGIYHTQAEINQILSTFRIMPNK